VLALIGERGREVREFLEMVLDEEFPQAGCGGRLDFPTAPPSNASSPRMSQQLLQSIRDKGKKVLLMLDSVTRFARAQRSIGLAAGEPPARRGFFFSTPPSSTRCLPCLRGRDLPEKKAPVYRPSPRCWWRGMSVNEPVPDEVRSDSRRACHSLSPSRLGLSLSCDRCPRKREPCDG
jgi:type III secretion protein N (ATPase)